MNEDTVYPDGVIDKAAFDEMLSIETHPLLSPDKRIIETSVQDFKIDIAIFEYRLKKMIKDLPEEEQRQILAKKSLWQSLNGKINFLRRKAFGLHNSPYAIAGSLLEPKKAAIIELFGRFHSSEEVHKAILEWGYKVSRQVVEDFRKRHLSEIQVLQDDYKKNYSDNRLSYKKSRLEELLWLYNHRKQIYEDTNSKSDYELLLKTLEQVRREVEPNELRVSIDGQLTINHQVNNHIKKEMLKDMSVNDIIVARVAARMGKSPAFLINSLHNSFYAKFAGFEPADKSLEEDRVVYPSNIVYNWDEIAIKNKELNIKQQELETPPQISEPQKQTNLSLKELLIQKIQDRKQNVNEATDQVNEITKKRKPKK